MYDEMSRIHSSSMTRYVRRVIPEKTKLEFIFKEDFDGDGRSEAVLGYCLPVSAEQSYLYILHIFSGKAGYRHEWLFSTDPRADSLYHGEGCLDCAYVKDTNGDKQPEFLLGLSTGGGYSITPHVFHWIDQRPTLVWKNDPLSSHGDILVEDVDEDGTAEIIIHADSAQDFEILENCEAFPRIQESWIFKWNGSDYMPQPYPAADLEQISLNNAAAFLNSLWKEDYSHAYQLAMIPFFLGLDGLDDPSLEAFSQHVSKYIRPGLVRNLEKHGLEPLDPEVSCCRFLGADDLIKVDLIKDKAEMKVSRVEIVPRELAAI